MTTIIVIEIETGKEKLVVYAPNKKGNKQFNVDGKFYTDSEFDKKFIIPIIKEDNNESENTHTYENGEPVTK